MNEHEQCTGCDGVLGYEFKYEQMLDRGTCTDLCTSELIRPGGGRVVWVKDLVESTDGDDVVAWIYDVETTHVSGYSYENTHIDYDEPDEDDWAENCELTNITPLTYK